MILSNPQGTARDTRASIVAANVALFGLWLWLYRPVLGYLARTLPHESFRTNQIVLVGVAVLLVLRARRDASWRRLLDAPAPVLIPLVLALGGSVLYLLAERWLDVHLLSAMLFGLASYGLVGLWMSPAHWRRSVPVALLLIAALPLSDHIHLFLGYPMRALTATLVRDGFAVAGIASLGVDTVMVFENGISQVDVPCSGVKSLWTGGMFLLAATWIERRPLDRRWLLIATLFGALLFIANLARVAALVAAGPIAGLPLLAEMLHVPLGVVGFVACCTVAALLLRQPDWSHRKDAKSAKVKQPLVLPLRALRLGGEKWLALGLSMVVLVLGLLYAPRPLAAPSDSALPLRFPAQLIAEPLAFTARERQWLTQDGAQAIQRTRFRWRGLSGTMIFVASRERRAHHQPERCFTVYGLTISNAETQLVGSDVPVRVLSLNKPGDPREWTATYWFQSADRTVDEYGSRFWADFALERRPWVLVSILFDNAHDPHAADVQAFYHAVHHTVQQTLTKEVLP